MDQPRFAFWPYIVDVPRLGPALDLDTQVKPWLKITGSSQDTTLNLMIEAVANCAESLSGRILVNTGFKTLRNGFSDFKEQFSGGDKPIKLRRSPIFSMTSFEYTKDDDTTGVLVLDTDFFIELSTDFSSLRPIDCWPDDPKDMEQVVEIKFVAGFGIDFTAIPADLTTAMLMHLANMNANRGDCCESAAENSGAAAIYQKYRIIEV